MKKLILISLLFAGCTDAERGRLASYGDAFIVELYSGGKIVATFESTGKVDCTEGGICQFVDAKTGKFTRTTGDIVVRVK